MPSRTSFLYPAGPHSIVATSLPTLGVSRNCAQTVFPLCNSGLYLALCSRVMSLMEHGSEIPAFVRLSDCSLCGAAGLMSSVPLRKECSAEGLSDPTVPLSHESPGMRSLLSLSSLPSHNLCCSLYSCHPCCFSTKNLAVTLL